MTARERALAIFGSMVAHADVPMVVRVTAAIEDAVTEEREACAKALDDSADNMADPEDFTAECIRGMATFIRKGCHR